MAVEVRHLTLVESRDSIVHLSVDEASSLQSVGKQLAGAKKWWRDEGESARDHSVVRCSPLGEGRWQIRVSDAIGVIGLPGLQVAVEPKIPTRHLLYLLEASGEFPRLAPQRALALRDLHLWELILHWYAAELETLLRRGLLRDYEEIHEELPTLRGSVDAVATGRRYYQGHLAFECAYEEFDFDTPPNRLLAEAARIVVGSPVGDVMLRRRAKRALSRFEAVGNLRAGDLRWRPDRRAGYYSNATLLARHIIRGVGRTISHGQEPSTTFLIRTPEMVEAGLRALLQNALPHRKIEKRGVQLEGATMTLNPDLVLDSGQVVGDVKYKLLARDWPRPDLYQLVAFVTGFRARRGVLVHFTTEREDALPSLRVGDVGLDAVSWLARDEIEPNDALSGLALALESLAPSDSHSDSPPT